MHAMTRDLQDDERLDGPVRDVRTQGNRVAASADPDRDAVLTAQENPAAFETIYELYFDSIFRYCLYRSASRDDAEDAASVIFERALGAIERFDVDGTGTFRAWLFSIAHNTIANRHCDRRPTGPLEDARAICDPSPSPEEIVTAADEAEKLHRLLEELPSDHRRVVELQLVGLRGTEIASVMGRSHGSIKLLQLRAFKQLRPLLSSLQNPRGEHDATP